MAHPLQRKLWRIPIKMVTVVGLGLLVTLALASILYLGFSVAQKNTDQLLSDKVETTLNAVSSQVDRHLQPVEQQALQIGRSFEKGYLSLDDTAKLQTYLTGFFSASTQISAIGLIQPDNQMIGIARQSMTLFRGSWPKQDTFAARFDEIARTKKPQWNPPIWSQRLGQSVATYYSPLTIKGAFVAVLVQTVPVAELSRFLVQETYLDGVPFIYYDDNKLIAHPKLISWKPAEPVSSTFSITTSEIGETILEDLLADKGTVPKFMTALKNTTSKRVMREGRAYLMFTRTLTRYGTAPWTLGLYMDARAASDPVQRLIVSLVVAIGFLILTVGIAIYGGVLFSRPIRTLAAAMEQVRQDQIKDVAVLPRSDILEFDEAAQAFNRMVVGLRERDLIRRTLGRYVPAKIAESLLKKDGALATEETIATVLFADIEGFTGLTESLGPEGIVELLNAYFSDMVDIIERHGGVVTQFQGDAILATFNIPIRDDLHARKALIAALEMQARSNSQTFKGHRVRTRIGVNTGRLIAGAVGAQGRLNYTVHGDAVNLAARLEQMNKDHGTYILTTQATVDLSQGLLATYVGETQVRGQTAPVMLYTLPDQEISV